jgi:hypothetical protein
LNDGAPSLRCLCTLRDGVVIHDDIGQVRHARDTPLRVLIARFGATLVTSKDGRDLRVLRLD